MAEKGVSGTQAGTAFVAFATHSGRNTQVQDTVIGGPMKEVPPQK